MQKLLLYAYIYIYNILLYIDLYLYFKDVLLLLDSLLMCSFLENITNTPNNPKLSVVLHM